MSDWTPPTDKDRLWALQEAAKFGGLCPHTQSVAELLKSLERDGLLHNIEAGPIWEITPKGRAELAKLRGS